MLLGMHPGGGDLRRWIIVERVFWSMYEDYVLTWPSTDGLSSGLKIDWSIDASLINLFGNPKAEAVDCKLPLTKYVPATFRKEHPLRLIKDVKGHYSLLFSPKYSLRFEQQKIMFFFYIFLSFSPLLIFLPRYTKVWNTVLRKDFLFYF